MGLYINPLNQTKEAWLQAHMTSLAWTTPERWLATYSTNREQGLVPVVLVDNRDFTALAVAYDQREALDFSRADGRFKIFATVPREALADKASGVGEDQLATYSL